MQYRPSVSVRLIVARECMTMPAHVHAEVEFHLASVHRLAAGVAKLDERYVGGGIAAVREHATA